MLQFADSIQKTVKTYPQAVPKTRMKWYSPKAIEQHKIVSLTGVTGLVWPSLVRKINENIRNSVISVWATTTTKGLHIWWVTF